MLKFGRILLVLSPLLTGCSSVKETQTIEVLNIIDEGIQTNIITCQEALNWAKEYLKCEANKSWYNPIDWFKDCNDV